MQSRRKQSYPTGDAASAIAMIADIMMHNDSDNIVDANYDMVLPWLHVQWP